MTMQKNKDNTEVWKLGSQNTTQKNQTMWIVQHAQWTKNIISFKRKDFSVSPRGNPVTTGRSNSEPLKKSKKHRTTNHLQEKKEIGFITHLPEPKQSQNFTAV